MNNWIGLGRTAGEIKVSDSGKMATVNFAVDRPFPFNKGKDGGKVTDFFNLRFLGENNVERATKYLKKGTKIEVRAIVCRDSYKDGDNYKEYNFMIVQDWEFAESKKAAAANNNDGDAPAVNKSAGDDFMTVDNDSDDDVPF